MCCLPFFGVFRGEGVATETACAKTRSLLQHSRSPFFVLLHPTRVLFRLCPIVFWFFSFMSMQSAGLMPNFFARTSLASTFVPSWPEVPLNDPDADNDSDEELDESAQLEVYQRTEYQREKTRRLVPAAPVEKPEHLRTPGWLAPPLKRDHTRPPGGVFAPLEPKPPIPGTHPLEKPKCASDRDPVRISGLGLFATLTDPLVAKICSRAPCRKALLALSSTSRAMYQLANWDTRVWKSIALCRWGGDFSFKTSWKLTAFFSGKGADTAPEQLVALATFMNTMPPTPPTPSYATSSATSAPPHSSATEVQSELEKLSDNPYAVMNLKLEQSNLEAGTFSSSQPSSSSSTSSNPSNLFIRIPGFYSETMYKEWYLSQVDLDGWYHDTGHVPRIRAGDINLDQFRQSFLRTGQPCIITDVVPTWPAAQKWHPDKLMDEYCETLIKINEYADNELRVKMTMRDFLVYMRENEDYKPLYVFDSSFQRRAPNMLSDYGIPQYFWEDLLAALDDQHRPAFRWWLFGSARTGTPFHQDPNGTSAWNAVTHGHKRWALYPSWMQGAPGSFSGGHQINSLKWWSLVYPKLAPHEKPIEFVQGPGELIFIPSGWWHAVLNLDETVSVTQNFVNKENLDAVVHSLFHSNMQGVINYWRTRLAALRPELYQYIGDRVAIEASYVTSQRAQQLEEQLGEQQEAFEKREEEMQKEIERLKQMLADAGLQEQAATAAKLTSTASLTAKLIAQQRAHQKKKRNAY